jgi:acetoin utilization deacetylase AcuC-like enzyme
MESFRPELVLISAGFDSRVDDPLGHFQLTDADFAELTRRMIAWQSSTPAAASSQCWRVATICRGSPALWLRT